MLPADGGVELRDPAAWGQDGGGSPAGAVHILRSHAGIHPRIRSNRYAAHLALVIKTVSLDRV